MADHPFLELRTSRLILRRFRPSDARELQAYRADPEVARYQSWDPAYSLEEAEAFTESVSRATPGTPGEWFQFAAVSATTGHLIGDAGLRTDAEDPGLFELGLTISAAHQRQGYAVEMATAVISYAFTTLATVTFQAITHARNEASIRTLEHLNFTRTETNDAVFKGEECQEHTYELTAPER